MIIDLVDGSDKKLESWVLGNVMVSWKTLYKDLKENGDFQSLNQKFCKLNHQWSKSSSTLKKFWLSYVLMVDLTLFRLGF